jgi:hypothetical protein
MGSPQGGLFCAIVQLMTFLRFVVLAAAVFVHVAWAQQSKQPAKTTEQQARSYILSAFMTGAAPAVVSDDAKVAPGLRERLALAPEADSRALYIALVGLTAGKSLTVRPAKIDELERTETQVETGKPVFALDVSDSTFVMQYDLERDSVTTIADASRPVAVTSPVTAPEPPQAIAPALAEAAKPAAEPASAAPAAEPAAAAPAIERAATPEPAPGARVQVIEPREPRLATPAAAAAPAKPAPMQVSREQPRLPPLKPNGACVIKPVMSDQDLVNCGASPRY